MLANVINQLIKQTHHHNASK